AAGRSGAEALPSTRNWPRPPTTAYTPLLRRETLAEGHQQFWRTLDADSSAEQGPQQAPLFRQEAQPRLAVGGHMQVGLALVAVPHLHGAVPDHNSCLLRLFAGEGEVVHGAQPRRLAGLEEQPQPEQEAPEGGRPHAAADPLDLLLREAA